MELTDSLKSASIMASAIPLCFYAMQKHLTIEGTKHLRTQAVILSGRKWPIR